VTRSRGRSTSTARDTLDDKIEALRGGGDDYVTKPFSLAEIIVRAQAILRRAGAGQRAETLRYADLVLDDGPPPIRTIRQAGYMLEVAES